MNLLLYAVKYIKPRLNFKFIDCNDDIGVDGSGDSFEGDGVDDDDDDDDNDDEDDCHNDCHDDDACCW